MKKILIYIQPDILEPTIDRIKEFAEVTAFPSNTGYIQATNEVIEKIKDTNILFSNMNITKDILNIAEKLEYIQRYGIGYDNVDINAATKCGVIVCNIAEIMAESVAQHTIALILDSSKKISYSDRMIRSRNVERGKLIGLQLWGKTLGIIGLGSIGKRVALKMKLAFNMRVLAYDPFILPSGAQLFNAEIVDLKKLLKESDVVSVNCSLTNETFHLIGVNELKIMKKDAIIVNTSRGQVIDEIALINALKEGIIAGAGLDVFENEVPGSIVSDENPLNKLNNVILTPHVSSSTKEAQTETREAVIYNLERYLRGEKPYWIINPEASSVVKKKF